MKTLLISIALLTSSLTSFAQSAQYTTAMTEGITALKSMGPKTDVDDMVDLANRFERIAGAETTEWLPRYYAGLCYSYLGYMAPAAADKDKYLDKAVDFAGQATRLSPKNDEIAVLNAQIAQARLVVDPQGRWQEYGPVAQAELDKAIAINANNPRIYVLQGSSLMYTPEQFGGGPKTACPLLMKAKEKMATFKPANALSPNWGQGNIEPLLAKCGQ